MQDISEQEFIDWAFHKRYLKFSLIHTLSLSLFLLLSFSEMCALFAVSQLY